MKKGLRKRPRLHKSVPAFDWTRIPADVWQCIYKTGILTFSDFVALAVTSKTLNWIIQNKVPWQELCHSGMLVNPYNRIRSVASSERTALYRRLREEIVSNWCCCCCSFSWCTTGDEVAEKVPRRWSSEVGVWLPQCIHCFRQMGGRTVGWPIDFTHMFACCPPKPRSIKDGWAQAYLESDVLSYYRACSFRILVDEMMVDRTRAARLVDYLKYALMNFPFIGRKPSSADIYKFIEQRADWDKIVNGV